MRKLFVAVVAVALVAPSVARAGGIIEASFGVGSQTSPTIERQPVNVMLAPGLTFASEILRAEVGLVGNFADVQNSKFDLELRPMLVVKPPLFPLYLRGILAFSGLLNGPSQLAYGGALGLEFGALGAAVFLEAGLLPRTVDVPATPLTPATTEMHWVAEGRLGMSYSF